MDVEKGDVSSGYGSMDSHNYLEQNVFYHWLMIMIGLILILMRLYIMDMWVVELVY